MSTGYDFDVESEGFQALHRWIDAAESDMNGHSRSERLAGAEQLRRCKELIDAILAPKVAESSVEGFYIEPRRYG